LSQHIDKFFSSRSLYWKFAAGVNDTGGNLPPVSTTLAVLVANLPPVLLSKKLEK
jgi:hypothetical protein